MRKFVYAIVNCLLAVCLLNVNGNLFAQAPKPLTSVDLVQMRTAGFDDQTIVNAIGANGVSLDTSVQGLLSLKRSGLSDKVINAALAAAAPKSPTAAPDESGVPDDIGAYALVKDQLTPLPVEVVNFKTSGTLGTAFSYGIAKTKLKGILPGDKSSARLAVPATFVLRCADGTAPTEYQLIHLDLKKDTREFIDAKMNVAGASAGVDKQAVALNFQRIGHNTYKATVSDLNKGEYGFLAPGHYATTNGASSGKLYTFGVAD